MVFLLFLGDWFKLATYGGSLSWKLMKVFGAIVAVLVPFTLDEKMFVKLANGTELLWHPPVGFAISLLIIFVWGIVSFTIAWLKKPVLTFVVDEIERGVWKGHFRVKVMNTSRTTTIHDCEVRVERSEPRLDHTPFRLHCSGEVGNPSEPEPKVTLHPRQARNFDVVITFHDGTWKISSVGGLVPIPKRRNIITLAIHGRDAYPCEKTFIIDNAKNGPNADLDFYQEGKPVHTERASRCETP